MATVAVVVAVGVGACAVDVGPWWSRDAARRGRIVTIAAVDDPARPRNVAQAWAAGAAAANDLWETDSEISDWLPSPDGRRAMYRIVWHYVPKTEALVVRALTPGAPERYVVMGEPELGRLAGQVWSPDGDALAYGKQVGHVESFSGAGGTRRWEMRAVSLGPPSEADGAAAMTGAAGPYAPGAAPATADAPPALDGRAADRRLFALDGAALGANAFTLVAWSPERARAAVLEVPAAGGGVQALRIYDTKDGHLVARVAPGGDDARVAASADGTRVAWLSAAAGVGTVDVATGQWRPVRAVDEGYEPIGLVWSFDGRWLAWAERSERAAEPRGSAAPGGPAEVGPAANVAILALRPGGWRPLSTLRVGSLRVERSDGGANLPAIAPDGGAGLLTDVRADGAALLLSAPLERWRPEAVPVVDADLLRSERVVNPGIWGLGWWPDEAAGR